ncbi:MAG: hypothetical protein IJ855_07390 [Bacteroidales bacterium]|nr:hypothetical protein [Bacteroidales bacterium]
MKNFLLISASVLLAACIISCKDKKTSPDVNVDYVDDMKGALCLSEEPVMDNEPVEQESETEFVLYEGTLGNDKARIVYILPSDRIDAEDPSLCGSLAFSDAPDKVFTLKEISNEGNPEGYNDVVIEVYNAEGEKTGVIEGKIEGRGDGFNGTFTNPDGTKKPFAMMQQY